MLATKLIACQRLVQVWPCAEERQGSAYSGRVQCCNYHRKKGEARRGKIDRNMGYRGENQTHTPIYQNLFSKQLFPGDYFPMQAGQWTVCPPTTDSSPGKVLLNHSTQRQTSRQKNCLCKGGLWQGTSGTTNRMAPPHGAP